MALLLGGPVSLAGQLEGDYESAWRAGDEQSAFHLSRAEVGLGWAPAAAAHGEVRVEAVRSADRQSLFGVAGNSLVLRARRAWGGLRGAVGPVHLDGRLGLVGDPWVQGMAPAAPLRDLSPSVAEAWGLLHPADLGLRVVAGLWDERLVLDGAIVNGEGHAQEERNAGKDVAVSLRGVPWRGAAGAVHLGLLWRDGSSGAGSVPADRLAAAARFQGAWVGGGVEWARADGLEERADRAAQVLSAFVYGAPWPGLPGALARVTRAQLDLDDAEATEERLAAGLYWDALADPAQRLRLYLIYEARRFGETGGVVAGAPAASDVDLILLRLSLDTAARLEVP